MSKRVVLMILDGWGIAKDKAVSAIDKAQTPFIDSLYHNYPNSQLQASGLSVGLPDGQMGNSEVGHMNLGAGRVVYQDLVRINKAVEEGDLKKNETLMKALNKAKAAGKKVHFIGLVSDGGVHSHLNHLIGLCQVAEENGNDQVYIHAFTDGRDKDPTTGLSMIEMVEKGIANTKAKIASVVGRYYAMDRDKRWERVQIAYDLLVKGKGSPAHSASDILSASYAAGVTDEFIKPAYIQQADGSPIATIEEGDTVIMFNFRTDRGRELTQVLTQEDMPDYGMKALDLDYVTMTRYDETFKGVDVLYTKENPTKTLGQIVSEAGKKQIRIAETEKYPHVTFFFSGGQEQEFEGESRILIPSPKVATYDLQPEMSAQEIADAISAELEAGNPDFVCLNFANPDMVGHTGVMEAAMKACEKVDACAKQVVEAGLKNDYTFLILADHGNSDKMLNEDGSVNTAHTTQPVPYFLVGNDTKKYNLQAGKLGDVAPTIATLMGIPVPAEMDGELLTSTKA